MKTVLFNTHDLVLLFTIFQCVLFAFFLLTLKKGKKTSNILLASFLLSYAAIPLDTLIFWGEAFRSFTMEYAPRMFHFFGTANWIEAPLLLLYVRSLIYKDYKVTRKDLIYFLPAFIVFIDHIVSWQILDKATQLAMLDQQSHSGSRAFDHIVYFTREIFRLACVAWCLIELKSYQKKVINEVADIEDADLNWLKILVLGFLLIHVNNIIVSLGVISFHEFNIFINHETLGLITNYAVMFLIACLLFFSLGHSTVFKGIDNELNNTSNDKDPIDPKIIDTITRYMESKKPYLNHFLTLENLANQLDMAPRALSQVINRHFNKNFFEFINFYRIEESKALLLSDSNKRATMLDIMDKAGFNSKATFNTFFKKLVGCTPTQFKKDNIETANKSG